MSSHVRDRLFDYVRGDISAEESAIVLEHVAHCTPCRDDLRMIREAVDILPAREHPPSEEQDDQFWASFPALVEERIRAGRRPGNSVVAEAADRFASFIHFNGLQLLAGSGALAAAALAFVLLRPAPVTAPAEPEASSPVMRLEPAGVQLHDYLRKSRVLLVGVSNLRTEGGEAFDLSVERRESRALVHEARDLRRQALDPRSARLVGDLEKIMIALANSDERHDAPDVEIIRSGIRHNNLLFKIRMTESALAAANDERNAR